MTAAPHNSRADLAELLAFYASAGVDEALEEQPVNRFAEARPPVRVPAAAAMPAGENAAPQRSTSVSRAEMGERPNTAPAMRTSPAMSTVPDEAQAALARQLARSAASLDELRQHM
ncbi:MAG: uracil-DNA glycosylase, partial [Mesorhizobium sp.]